MALIRQTLPRRSDATLLLAAVVLYGCLLAFTIPDYGPSWDVWEYYIGDHYFAFYTSLDPRHLDFTADSIPLYHTAGHPDFHQATLALRGNDVLERPYLIWPLGAACAAASKWFFFSQLHLYDPLDASNLMLVPFAVVLLLAMFRFTQAYYGRWPAVIATLTVATYPRLWADFHNNYKDPPTAVWFTLTIFAFVIGLRERRWGWLLVSAVCWGLGLATKANGLFLPVILGPWFVLVLWRRWRARQRLLGRGDVVALAAYPFIGLGLMLVLWPLLLVHWPHNLQLFLASLSSRGLRHGGAWNFDPVRNAVITMPLPVLALLVLGLLVIAVRTWRRRGLADLDLLALLWLVVPVARVAMPGAIDFDGIRHWLEFIPGLALVAGMGGGAVAWWLERRLRGWRRGVRGVRQWAGRGARGLTLAACAACFVAPVHWCIVNHPNELVFFNRLVGGLGGAQARGLPDTTDYWASSYRQGFAWLYDHAQPGSLVFLGVAEHLGVYTHQLYLRSDLLLSSINGRSGAQVQDEILAHPGEVYLMYITRPAEYHSMVKTVDPVLVPVYEITVDGGVILKILRLQRAK